MCLLLLDNLVGSIKFYTPEFRLQTIICTKLNKKKCMWGLGLWSRRVADNDGTFSMKQRKQEGEMRVYRARVFVEEREKEEKGEQKQRAPHDREGTRDQDREAATKYSAEERRTEEMDETANEGKSEREENKEGETWECETWTLRFVLHTSFRYLYENARDICSYKNIALPHIHWIISVHNMFLLLHFFSHWTNMKNNQHRKQYMKINKSSKKVAIKMKMNMILLIQFRRAQDTDANNHNNSTGLAGMPCVCNRFAGVRACDMCI